MKQIILVVFVTLAFTAAAIDLEPFWEAGWRQFFINENVTAENRGLILNSQAKKAVRNFVHQLPCGFPEYNIPPLAPYTNPNLHFHLTKSVVETMIQMMRFRFDGLDEMEINKLKVSYTFSKTVKFQFNFKRLKASAYKLKTDTLIDLMNQIGISVRYEGTGPMEFTLENLSFKGQFKYKMPIFWGSIKIYKFSCVVNLGAVSSNIGGILGNGVLNHLINEKIEYEIPALINSNAAMISDMIEQLVVPTVNEKMQGKKVWYILGQLCNSNKKCYPTPAPWLAVE